MEEKENNFSIENKVRGGELNISPFAEPVLNISNNKEPKTNYFPPEPFVRLTLSNKPKNLPENQLEIVLNFCLTIDSEPNLSLFRDFEEIIEDYSQGQVIN